MWTPPHFWALALYRARDYEDAGVPMLPVVAGQAETRRQILIYSLILVPATLALAGLGVVGPAYWVPAAVLGLLFVALAVRLSRRASVPQAVQLFRYSILYLFLLFGSLTVDAASRILLG
jgi:protoheme IX farnesyltransferase